MDYGVYHDESKQLGYWHGILLVPVSARAVLLRYLADARANTGYRHPLTLKRVRKTRGTMYECARSWVQLGVVSLMSQQKGPPEAVDLGCRVESHKHYAQLRQTIGCKFILFRERHDHAEMTGHRDYGSKVETTFRMGLKGGLHFLGSEEDPINIVEMHFDGHEHYRRHVDRDRIVGRLHGLRSYCSIAESDDIIDDRTSNHKRVDCQDYDDCQLLQLADLMVGSFQAVLTGKTRPWRAQLEAPVKAIVDRYRKGYRRMQNSRWRNSFCVSECYLESGLWKFDRIECEEMATKLQLPLPTA